MKWFSAEGVCRQRFESFCDAFARFVFPNLFILPVGMSGELDPEHGSGFLLGSAYNLFERASASMEQFPPGFLKLSAGIDI